MITYIVLYFVVCTLFICIVLYRDYKKEGYLEVGIIILCFILGISPGINLVCFNYCFISPMFCKLVNSKFLNSVEDVLENTITKFFSIKLFDKRLK